MMSKRITFAAQRSNYSGRRMVKPAVSPSSQFTLLVYLANLSIRMVTANQLPQRILDRLLALQLLLKLVDLLLLLLDLFVPVLYLLVQPLNGGKGNSIRIDCRDMFIVFAD